MCKENIHHTITTPSAAWTIDKGYVDPCFHVGYGKFWLHHLPTTTLSWDHKTFFQSSVVQFVEPVWIKLQFRVLSSQELFCFCIPSASRNLLLTGYFLLFRPFSVNPRDRPSLWNTHGRPSATSNFYMFKLEVSLSLPHSDAQFELNQVVLTNPDQS